MKIKVRITNLSGKQVSVRFEPTGEFTYLPKDDVMYIELEKRSEGFVDFAIEDDDSIVWEENNQVFIDRIYPE